MFARPFPRWTRRRTPNRCATAAIALGITFSLVPPAPALAAPGLTPPEWRDLKISAFASGTFGVGERGTVLVAVENHGPEPVTNVAVRIDYGRGLEDVVIRGAFGQVWTCSEPTVWPRSGATSIVCTTDVVEPDSHRSLIVTASASKAEERRWVTATADPDDRIAEDDATNNSRHLELAAS